MRASIRAPCREGHAHTAEPYDKAETVPADSGNCRDSEQLRRAVRLGAREMLEAGGM